MKNNEYQEFDINGQVIRFYDQKGRQKHLYEAVDGDDTRQILNVTTVLAAIAKPALVQWAANEAAKIAAVFAGIVADQDYDIYKSTLESMFDDLPDVEALASIYDKARYRHKELSQEALDIGSKVHGLIEDYIKERMECQRDASRGEVRRLCFIDRAGETQNTEIMNALTAFFEFDDLVEEYLECEQLCYRSPSDECPLLDDNGGVVYDEYGEVIYVDPTEYIGRKDFKAQLKDGRVGWFDIKTSKDIYPENILQLLAYACADNIAMPTPLEFKIIYFEDNEVIGVVGCGKDGELKRFIEPINKWLKYYNTFIHLLEFKRGYDQLVKDFNKAYKENK